MCSRTVPERVVTYREALREALHFEMASDERVLVLGEDVGDLGGIHGVTRGLKARFGASRVVDTAISESAIVGVAIGAALQGMRPIAEIMCMDFMPCAMDQIVNSLAKLIYIYGGAKPLPVVIRTPQGASGVLGMHHSQSLEAHFVHTPGLIVAVPSTPFDAKGLLTSAMRSPNPVIFIEHKTLYGMEGPVPADSYTVPFGRGQVVREGRDVTIVTWGSMVKKTEAAAERLQHDGVEAEIIDLRTLSPWDRALVTHSVAKTRHLLVVHEACKTGGVGAEIIASTIEDWQGEQQPICARVAAKDAPIPYSKPMQEFVLPSVDEIASAASRCLEPRAMARQGHV